MKNDIKCAFWGAGILAVLAASIFLLLHLRKTTCDKKYEPYLDRLEFAQYTPNSTNALALLDSIAIPGDCLCSREARKVEYQKYIEKAYFFSHVFMNRDSQPDLDSTLLYCNKALKLTNRMWKKDLYASIADVYLLMGLTYEKSGDCKNALLYADKAIALFTHYEDLLTMNNALSIKSNCLKAAGKTEEAKLLEQKEDSLQKEISKEIPKVKP